MSVLSDATIREEMGRGRLIKGGDVARAVHCSYEFLPAKIYPGGLTENDAAFVVDWTDGTTANRRFLVHPGAMVWIRVREQACLPDDICGLWLQTNTLSRKGLLLINMSLVEPGYEGPLSCHFVNFGKAPVEIYPETALAKLLFLKLDKDAAQPFKKVLDRYDEMIAGLAAHSAKSFLQVTEMAGRLETARKAAEDAIKERADTEFQRLKGQLDNDSQKRRMDEATEVKKDLTGYLKKTFGWIVAAIVFLGILNAGTQWIGSKVTGNDDAIDQRIERALAKHVMINVQAAPSAPATFATAVPSALGSAPAPPLRLIQPDADAPQPPR